MSPGQAGLQSETLCYVNQTHSRTNTSCSQTYVEMKKLLQGPAGGLSRRSLSNLRTWIQSLDLTIEGETTTAQLLFFFFFKVWVLGIWTQVLTLALASTLPSEPSSSCHWGNFTYTTQLFCYCCCREEGKCSHQHAVVCMWRSWNKYGELVSPSTIFCSIVSKFLYPGFSFPVYERILPHGILMRI